MELGFWACRFILGMYDEPNSMLMNSSSMTVGWMGVSCSLEITISSSSLSMPHAPNFTMHPTTLPFYFATHQKLTTQLHNSHSAQHYVHSTKQFLPPTSCVLFIGTSQLELIISKSTISIMTKFGSNDTKSIDNLTFLTVGSIINAYRFNNRRQLTILTTCIYY